MPVPMAAVLAHFNLAPAGLGREHFEYARLETGSHTFGVDRMRKVEGVLPSPLQRRSSHRQPPFADLDLELLWIGIRQGDFDPIVLFIFDDQRLAKIAHTPRPAPALD